MNIKHLALVLVTVMAAVSAPSALAQNYPERAITVIVPFTPGGVSDIPPDRWLQPCRATSANPW